MKLLKRSDKAEGKRYVIRVDAYSYTDPDSGEIFYEDVLWDSYDLLSLAEIEYNILVDRAEYRQVRLFDREGESNDSNEQIGSNSSISTVKLDGS